MFFLFFLDKIMVKELWKTNLEFFWFLGVCGFSFFLAAQSKTKTFSEKFWCFGFFEVLVILYFLRFNPNQENSKYKVRQLRS